ncbi:proton pump-interactor 1-like [Ipomoea triloba]|uniref:proton pump-interactor 1-like n=1 Tax=Ipomoea triloba TaxID=35885 RepID=UPI00125CDF03|nr:proton pump-interactor 1-like [Ipomoea triloba]XP_031121288.1 proton pump-interactor 1-like [Ipomoea triloba]
MGVDVESKLAHVSVEAGSENGGLKENGTVPNEPIKFGSHGTEEPVKEDVKKAPAINLPKDAVVEDWPAPQQIHSFYLVKYRTFEDQKLKAKLEQAEKELQKKNQARSQMIDNLRAKRAARSELINERKSLSAERQQFRSQIDEKRKVMEPLQQALGKLRGNNAFGRDRGSIIFSSEAELNDYIKSLQYRIQHESITLNEEKQILREIKQIEGTRDKVIANAAERAKIQESLGEKESIQSQVKLIGVDLDGVRKEQQVLSAKLKEIDDELDAMKKEIGTLEEELTALTQQRDKTFQSIQEFRKQREEGNSSFFQSRKLNLEARQLADKKDVAALRELSETEVDKFVAQWSSNKSFRDDYEKRILQSLDMRQLSKDGRMRNPDEKPLVLPETPNVPAPEVVVKTTQKALKEDSAPPPQPDASLASKAQKDKNSKQQKDGKKKLSKSSLEVNDLDDDEEIPGVTNLPKDSTPKRVVVDEETLKQMRREEEIAKNKQAIERKKKLAEKAAVKAALKAQKEAEKKLKDRERKAKKKAGVAVTDEPTEDPSEKTSEDAEPEKPEENVEAADEPMKPTTKDRKVGPLRLRPRVGAKGSDIHKVILKRKKSTNYWIWAAPAAAVVILLLLAVGYKFYA